MPLKSTRSGGSPGPGRTSGSSFSRAASSSARVGRGATRRSEARRATAVRPSRPSPPAARARLSPGPTPPGFLLGPPARPSPVSDETAGFALDPAQLRRAASETARAADAAQEAARALVAGLRALGAMLPGTRAGPAAEALAAHWEDEAA